MIVMLRIQIKSTRISPLNCSGHLTSNGNALVSISFGSDKMAIIRSSGKQLSFVI